MRIRSNPVDGNHPTTTAIQSIAAKTQQLFSHETRAVMRQNAIRRTIASLVETERMRLALAIAHRHDT